jgi:peptidyl-prolyl cis-trans isomerase A (cyclophilin A)
MTKRIILAALLAAAAPSFAQAPAASPVAETKSYLVRVALETEKGRIVLELDQGKAPVTTRNFLAYIDKGWLNGEPFYRAMPYGDGGLIQGGVRSNGNHQLPPIDVEVTGIKNVAGAIAMANAGPKSTRSDFFIMLNDIPAFDGPNGFAAFGRVVEGMDVVKAIFASPRSATKGEGVMKGQMLEPAIRITKAARVKA